MKKVISALLLIISFTSFASLKGETLISSFSTEIMIQDQSFSRFLVENLPGFMQESSLVADEYYFHHSYFYCLIDPEQLIHCSVYLSEDRHGSLTHILYDTDYGKGDVVQAMFDKREHEYANYRIEGNILQISTGRKVAQNIFNNLLISNAINKINGPHLHCPSRSKCTINIPIWDETLPPRNSTKLY
jgi:hypothetical protein